MLRSLLPLCDGVVFTRASNPRSLPAGTLESLSARLGGPPSETVADPARAVERARAHRRAGRRGRRHRIDLPDRRPGPRARRREGVDAVNPEPQGPSFLVMIGFVAVVVAAVILVFFGIGYGLGPASSLGGRGQSTVGRGEIRASATSSGVAFSERALAHLQRLAGPDAEFREGQLEAIQYLVEERRRVLCVQRTGWGKSAVYFVATALHARAGVGADAARLAAARPDAQPGAGRRVARPEGADDQLVEPRGVGRDRAGARPRRGRPADDLARAAEQPRLPARGAARLRRPCRPARRRRGALHQRLGPRLPARLPPDRGAPADARQRRRRALHDGDRQRPRGGRRRGPARDRRGRPADRARHARPPVAAARGRRPAGLGGAARLARHPRPEAAGQRHRLLPHDPRRRASSPTGCARRGSSAERLLAATRDPESRPGVERRLLAERGQGRRRHLGARHGLRQARPRLRRPLPGARVADRLLPAGRPRRAQARRGARACCCAASRTARSRTTSSRSRSRPRSGCARCSTCSRRSRAGAVAARDRAAGQRPPRPARGDAQGARGRGRRRPRRRALDAHERGVGLRRRARRARHRRAARRAGGDGGVREGRGLPHAVPARARSTTRTPSRAAAARSARSRSSPTRRRPSSCARPSSSSAAGRSVRPAQALDRRAARATSRRARGPRRGARCRTRTTRGGGGACSPSARGAPSTTSSSRPGASWSPSGRPARAG